MRPVRAAWLVLATAAVLAGSCQRRREPASGDGSRVPASEAPDTGAVVEVGSGSPLAAKMAAIDADSPFVEREVVERYAALLASGAAACTVSEPRLASMVSRRVRSARLERGVRLDALAILHAIDSLERTGSPRVGGAPSCEVDLDRIVERLAAASGVDSTPAPGVDSTAASGHDSVPGRP